MVFTALIFYYSNTLKIQLKIRTVSNQRKKYVETTKLKASATCVSNIVKLNWNSCRIFRKCRSQFELYDIKEFSAFKVQW
jgi:hypothetical protein